MNIYQRINEVRKAVDYAKKEKAVEGYKAVTHDQITALTREHLVAHGIVIVPVLTAQKVEPTGTQTSRGTPFVRMEASYRFDVVNVDDPTDKFSAEIAAHAIDHGDKAPGKVLSYAKKALMLKLLEIESGDEDEERQDQFKLTNKGAISPGDGAFEALNESQQERAKTISKRILELAEKNEWQEGHRLFYKNDLDNDMKLGIWELLRKHSKVRNKLKEIESLTGKAA